MRSKTQGLSIKKSNNQLSKSEKNILTSQANTKKRSNQSHNKAITQTHFTDNLDFESKRIERQENWLDDEIDGELEIADIDESDFQFH